MIDPWKLLAIAMWGSQV